METSKTAGTLLLKEAEQPDAPDQSSLEQLQELVLALRKKDEEIALLEQKLEEAGKARSELGRIQIPQLIRALGISELKLADGAKVVVSELADVSVPDEKEKAFLDFLVKRKEDDIVKTHIALPKMSGERRQAVLDFLAAYDYDYEAKVGVHPQTLKAYAKRLLGVGVEKEALKQGIVDKRYLRKEDVADVMNVFTFFDTKIVKKKVKL
jgi:hypothetical protein